MSAPNEYPPEKTGQYPPPQPGDTHQYPQMDAQHQYPPPPTDAQHYYPPPPPGGPPGYNAPSGTPPNQQHYTPLSGGAFHENITPTGESHPQYPPPPAGDPPHQHQQQPYQPYQPTAWIPEQNQYQPPPTGQTAAAGAATGAAAGSVAGTAQTSPHGKLSAWDKTRNTSKAGFDKLWSGFEKLGVPVNKFTNKIGSEAFWPQSLDKESDKCARILKSFCKDGFYSERPTDPNAPKDGPKGKPKVLVKIPQKVIKNAVALAIFTTMRTGLWVSGAGGSGVLIARLPDGSWSPPSGLLVHTAGVGFMAGIDIYDCVLVINTPEALAAFKKVRVSLGGEISVAAGPVGVGGIGEFDMVGERKRKPVWTYMKSRGLYAGAQVDGSIVIERNDENARFYGERLPASDILAGKLMNVPQSTRLLTEVLKEAEGRKDVNQHVLQEVDQVPPPGDMEVEKGSHPTKEQQEMYAPEKGEAARYA